MTPRTGVLLGLAFLLLLAAPSALAAAKTINVIAKDDGSATQSFEIGGVKNADIMADPGDVLTINLTNQGSQPHDFHVKDLSNFKVPATNFLTASGQSAQGTLTIPSDAKGKTYSYDCQVHPVTMLGSIKVSGTADSGKSGTPGFTAALAFAAVAGAVLLLRRRA